LVDAQRQRLDDDVGCVDGVTIDGVSNCAFARGQNVRRGGVVVEGDANVGPIARSDGSGK
jgi:hypothetical protein